MKTISFLLFLLIAGPVLATDQGAASPNAGQSLVSELSSDHVDISARYTGDKITLYGAMGQPSQVIVKVVSPVEPVALEQKGPVGPFWLSHGKHQIDKTPGLYYLLSSAPIDSILPAGQRKAYALNLADALKSMQITPAASDPSQQQTLKAAVLRLKQTRGYYAVDPKAVSIHGQRLYSTTISLPARLPLGDYQVSIYLVRHGKVIATESKQISVAEVRMEHWISSVAARHSWTFGVIFTFGMMLLGLILGVVLGRNRPRSKA